MWALPFQSSTRLTVRKTIEPVWISEPPAHTMPGVTAGSDRRSVAKLIEQTSRKI